MAITTIDGCIAGFKPPSFFHKGITPTLVIGKPQSLWGLGGIPGAGAFSGAGLNGNILKCTDTVTITIASPGVVTQTGHQLVNGNTVVLSTTGALPTGLTAATTYFVVNAATDTYQLSATAGGAAINTTGSQSGVHSVAALIDGQLPFYDPAAGLTQYLGRLSGSVPNGGLLQVCDRLWHNGGYTITSNGVQSSTTPAWPARDDDGATAGKGVLLGLEISAAAGAAAPTCAFSYTNSAGVAGRTGAFGFATANSPSAGSFFPMRLQAGDLGVKSLESIQLSASWVSGTMNMVAYRVLSTLDISTPGAGNSIDVLTGGMPQLFNGSVPFLMITSGAATAGYVTGSLTRMQG